MDENIKENKVISIEEKSLDETLAEEQETVTKVEEKEPLDAE
jgi:hypothetical protein